MSYVPYVQVVGQRGFEETRWVLIRKDAHLPDGDYGFLELYCSDPKCDCRRVLIHVIREDTADQVWATISYGFASPGFYGTWVGDPSIAAQLAGASLEPIGPQSSYAPALLEVFGSLIEAPEYTARLERHYNEVKHLSISASGVDRVRSPGTSRSKGAHSLAGRKSRSAC